HILYADGFEDLKHFTEVKKKAARDEGGQIERVHTYEDPEIPAYDPEFLRNARKSGRSGYSSQNLNLPRFLPPKAGERPATDEERDRLERAAREAKRNDAGTESPSSSEDESTREDG
ncbi:MAG: hypothetical protein RL885_16780, partial [Planctomycetota bacterium]